MHRFFLFFLTFLTLSLGASTTPLPTIAINSGNPAFPFPQFQPYQNASGTLGNLADYNGVGVTHAEMEQTIRDAYRIMMNRAMKMGESLGGIEYLYFNSPRHCTEGDGYGMLGAVAMADKTTFDGLWLWVHDHVMNKVKRYNDCKESNPDYRYSQLPAVYHNLGENSAADGDFDIAMSLLLAYRQWGEFMGIKDACGNQISYKQAAIDFLKGLSDTLTYVSSGALLSGDIGIDGYFKGGDSWAELSGWANAQNTATIGITKRVEQPGPTGQYCDYTAPAYFHAFANFLAEVDSAKYAWNIFQFRRAEASSDWLIRKLYQANPKNIPICGKVTISDTTPSFAFTGDMGEDFRLGWRTILNQMWHGNPASSWNPSTHLVVPNKANTYELDMAKRYATFLWDSRQSPWNHGCVASVGTDPFNHWGPMTLVTNTSMTGDVPADAFYFLNWIPSVGSPSAVISQEFKLMADLYRYLEIEWDVDTPGDGYLTSVPYYYHCWYRVLGLLVLSGNYHAPFAIKPTANMKVYLGIDKTFAFQKDTVTYTIDYRNYGSLDATGVTIVNKLHQDFVFVLATGGGVYNAASHAVNWNIGTVPGFKSATGIPPTVGQVKFKIVVANASQKQYRDTATITCTNGTGWTSNEYPNRITAVMERNYLDIAKRALIIKKTADKSRVKPGSTVQYTIEFENTSDAGWINGGRPGVHFSFAQTVANNGVDARNRMGFRIFHDANEAYINWGNYRVSYFLYDSLLKSIAGSTGTPVGWTQANSIVEPTSLQNALTFAHELITEGRDSLGRWNQRLILQLSDPTKGAVSDTCLATIDRHLSGYRGIRGRIHRGVLSPMRLVWFFTRSDWQSTTWSDDWSWDAKASQGDEGMYFPVTSDWTDLDNPDIPVNTWNPKACSTSTKTVKNILVEEWDGYTWRRVAGNGPMPGRDAINVTIRDTIPTGFSFVGFSGTPPLGIAPVLTGRVITWTIPKLQIKQKGTITYTVSADGTCPGAIDRRTVNRAWIVADKESPYADSVVVDISCDTVVRPPKPDHLDIILDTTAIDPRNDAPRQSITMDAGTQTTVAWVVIRDSLGNLLDSIRPYTWTSGDPAVVTVAGAGWQGTITKVGAGSTIIVVTSPGLKSDTMYVTTIATPPWPAIVSAVMLDNNADIIPDMLSITITDTFQVNQRLDSIAITYRGNGYSIPASAVTRSGVVLSIPFTTLSGIDARPSGMATLVMTVEAAEKRESKAFTDGVCPALLAADVLENDGTGNDILYLTFTEAIDLNVLIGKQLQLVKMPGGTVITLDINGIVVAQNDSMVSVEVSPAAQRPLAGDSLRLVPGSIGGIIADMARNRPHDLNRAVLLGSRAGPSSITSAWYIDGNADGVIDTVKIAFKRVVLPAELSSAVIQWDLQYYTIPIASIISSGASLLTIPVAGTVTALDRIVTGGAMDITVKFTQFPDIIRTAPVADSAAPVIDSATLFRGTYTQTGAAGQDTLVVKFSERAPAVSGLPYLVLSRASMTEYTFQGAMERNDGIKYRYVVTSTVTPGIGDSIWINSLAGVCDAGLNAQRNALNRRVLLKSVWPLSEWTIRITFNPFDPDTTKLPADFRTALGAGAPACGTGISARMNSPIDPLVINATITLYDAVGNIIVQKPMTNANGGLYFAWDGTRNGRKVGSGTYLAIVRIRENGKQVLSKRVALGVRRAR